MSKLVTFSWIVSVDVCDTFDETDPKQVAQVRHEAWMNVHESHGHLDEVADVPEDEAPTLKDRGE
jgi:hypothetical protein